MSLARAFTKRAKRPEVAPLPIREGSVRYAPGTIDREKISLPTELLSTTNMHALNAPDIRSVSTSSSTSSLRSAEGSEFSHIDTSFLDSAMTTPDTSSVEGSPTTIQNPEHTSFFFDSKTPKRSATAAGTSRSTASVASSSNIDTPALPQRALSHSKQAHQDLARKRSNSRLSPPPSALPAANVVRDSNAFFNGSLESTHPFGQELAQVDEVAEEFGAVGSNMDEEESLMASKGLFKFTVDDYLSEIEELYGGRPGDRPANLWI